jgi:ABC-type arginine/histidine transport system permease subunit
MDTIFMVVDQFSKLAKMAPIKTIVTTFVSTKLFFDMWVMHHGMPQFIISHRDAKFTTSF